MDPETIKTLLNLGLGGILIILMVTGQLIPKPFYEREVKRGDTATDASAKNADALRDVSGALRTVTDEVKGLRAELSSATQELRSVKDELLRSRS